MKKSSGLDGRIIIYCFISSPLHWLFPSACYLFILYILVIYIYIVHHKAVNIVHAIRNKRIINTLLVFHYKDRFLRKKEEKCPHSSSLNSSHDDKYRGTDEYQTLYSSINDYRV